MVVASQPTVSSTDENGQKGACYENKGVQYAVLVVAAAILSIVSSSKHLDYYGETETLRFTEDLHDKKLNSADEIEVVLPREQIEWMQNRTAYFETFYEIPFGQQVDEKLHAPADKMGPVLDFLVAGFPKCGTTTMMANLASIAPMPMSKDICTPPRRTVLYAYKNWPKKYGEIRRGNNFTTTTIANSGKLFRSSKCPMFIEEGWIEAISQFLPKTKLIVGIRHPIEWFLSFWKMQNAQSPYESLGICPCNVKMGEGRRKRQCNACRGRCPSRQLYCLGRARFHLTLARLGKTALSTEERQWLAPDDVDGGEAFLGYNISNSIFLYEQTQLRQGDVVWSDLAAYLGVSQIPHSRYKGSVGKGKNFTLCDAMYDSFRATMMPYSYQLSMWLQNFFLPVARDPDRPDVQVADVESFTAIIRTYASDPCHRLFRAKNGTYYVDERFGENVPAPARGL